MQGKARQFDICVYGGTAAGVVAAYSAAQMGANVILVAPEPVLGGMTTGGLGFTDIGNKQAVLGIAKQFYRRLGDHYGKLEQWVFEPHVAQEIIESYASHPNITLVMNTRLESVVRKGTAIRKASFSGGLIVKARQWIDCSYEGDLMAASGVSYVVGREDSSVYGECWNGSHVMKDHQFPDGVDPFVVPGDSTSGLLWGIQPWMLKAEGCGDDYVQAYNYRICLTDDPDNMIPIEKPDNYDPAVYELLVRLMAAQPSKKSLNDYFIWSLMPGRKTDVNNRGGFSTDMIGMNHAYPEASWEEREEIIQAHKDYTIGLLWFFGHDTRVPVELRHEMLRWGYPKDEYVKTGHWTPQLYVREARRMVGEYVATQADCESRTSLEDGIAIAAYTMDSHNTERVVIEKDGRKMVKNEGDVEIRGGLPYPVSYRSLTPKREECTNLLVPVCLSASHIAYGSIRMEPVFMATSQAAGIAAAKCASRRCVVQKVDVSAIQDLMASDSYLDGTPAEILIDDDNAAVTYSDGFIRRTGRGGYGPSWLEAKQPAGQKVTYTLPAELDGKVTIYSYQHTADHLAYSANFTLRLGDSVQQISFDRKSFSVQGQTKGDWYCLGSYDLKAGEEKILEMSTDDRSRPFRTDSILIIIE